MTITVHQSGVVTISANGLKGSKGDKGDAGSSALVWRSTWSAANTYVSNDYVSNPGDGLIYICILGHEPSHEPPNATYWLNFQGAQGESGNTILNGTAAPTTQGVNGDFYIETNNSRLYGPKSGGAWPGTYVTLIGATGAAGAAGTDGLKLITGVVAPTTEGVNGDCYINTATMTFYGPKASGTWPTGTVLIGAAGTNGTNGTNGTSAQILATTGAPAAGTGNNGDWAIDVAAFYIYGPKAAGTWPAGVYFKGAPGSAGTWYGPYNAAITYPAYSQVSYESGGVTNSYICTSPTTGVAPPNSPWQIVSGSGTSDRVIREVPTGTLNGSNCNFVLSLTPVAGSEEVFVDGKLMKAGGVDYTFSVGSPHIIFNASWASMLVPGVWIAVSYNHT